MKRVTAPPTKTQPFVLLRDGQPVVYEISDARIVLRRRGGVYTRYLVGHLPDGTRFEGSYGPATAAQVRQWEQAHGIGPAQRCAARALHALVDRLAEMVGAQAVLGACARLLSLAEGAA